MPQRGRPAASGSGSPARPRASASSRCDELEPLARRTRSTTAASQSRPLVPPVAEQLGVERADAQRRRRPRWRARARGRRSRGVLAGLRARALGVVDRAVDRPRMVVVRGAVVVVAVGAVGRVAARSLQTSSIVGRSIGTSGEPASVRSGRRCLREPWPKTSVRSTQVAWTPASSSSGSSHGACAHSGSQKPPRHGRRSARGGSRCRCELQPRAGVGRDQRQHRVRRRRTSTPRAARAPRAGRARRAARRPARSRAAARSQRRDRSSAGCSAEVDAVRLGAHVAQEAPEALHRARRLELVAEHRRQRQRDRRAGAVEDVEQRQVARSPSPRTATPRRTATSRSPRRRACGCAGRSRGGRVAHGRQTREEVQRAVEVASAAQREVARDDRRGEAVVERLGEARAACARVPAGVADAPARGGAACARGTGRGARRRRSAPRRARGTPRRGTP